MTNWDIIKFKYEVMGMSLEAIHMDTGLSMPLLEHNSKKWTQLSLVEEESGNCAVDSASRASRIYSVLKQSHLGPKYVELEMILLYKAIEIAENMDDSADSANISALKNLTEVLSNLLSHNPSLAPSKQSDDGPSTKENKWEINIVTQGGVQENKTINVTPM